MKKRRAKMFPTTSPQGEEYGRAEAELASEATNRARREAVITRAVLGRARQRLERLAASYEREDGHRRRNEE